MKMDARIAENILKLLSTATVTGPQQAMVMVEATQSLAAIVQAVPQPGPMLVPDDEVEAEAEAS
jgi:hypothetical protein